MLPITILKLSYSSSKHGNRYNCGIEDIQLALYRNATHYSTFSQQTRSFSLLVVRMSDPKRQPKSPPKVE